MSTTQIRRLDVEESRYGKLLQDVASKVFAEWLDFVGDPYAWRMSASGL